MTQPQYALSWDSYKTNICSGFSSLQQNGEFVDMTIAADGHLVKVHQVLVALASPFLKDLIASAPCQHPVIFLNNVSHKVLSYLLEYIYTGEAIVPSDNLPGFMEAAKSLHIKGLEGISDDHSFAGNDEMYSIVNQNDSEAVPKLRGAKRKATSISDTLDTPMEEQPVSGDEFEDSGPPEDIKDSTVRLQEDLKETYYQPVKKRPVSRNDDEDNSQPEVTENSTVRLQEDFKEIKAHVVTDTFTEIIPYKADSRWFSRGGEFYVVKRSRKDCLTLRCADFRCPVQWNLRAGKAGPVKGQHNHCPTPWVPNRNAMFQSLKERSMQENIPLKEIYDEEAAKFPDAAPHLLYENIVPSMRKWRRNAQDE